MPSSSRQKRRPSRKNKRKRSNDTAAFEFSTEVEEDYGVSKKRRLDCKAVALGIFVLTLMIVGASAEFISMLLRAAHPWKSSLMTSPPAPFLGSTIWGTVPP